MSSPFCSRPTAKEFGEFLFTLSVHQAWTEYDYHHFAKFLNFLQAKPEFIIAFAVPKSAVPAFMKRSNPSTSEERSAKVNYLSSWLSSVDFMVRTTQARHAYCNTYHWSR